MTLLKVAIVGLGRIGALWGMRERLREKPCSHVDSWLATKGVEVVAVCDTDPKVLEEVTKRYGVNGYSKILRLPPVDIVSIATPVRTHHLLLDFAIKHLNPKLVFCEKPLSIDSVEADRMVLEAKNAGVKLAVNHTRRWDPVYQKAAEAIRGGVYGKVIGDDGLFSGSWLEVGTHMADLYNWFGLPGTPRQVPTPYLTFDLQVFLEKGMIDIPANGGTSYIFRTVSSPRYEGVEELMLDARGGEYEVGRTPMLRAMEQLRDCVLKEEGGDVPLCTGEDGAAALRRIQEDNESL